MQVPPYDHVSRYCRRKCIDNGVIQATAFHLRLHEDSLSVNWLEYLRCTNREQEIEEIRRVYSTKLVIKDNEKIAVLNVGQMHDKVLHESSDNRNIEVRHDPSEIDPCHSGIYNMNPDMELIAELIVQVIEESYDARPLR